MPATTDDYVSKHVVAPHPLFDDAAEGLVKQYLEHFGIYPTGDNEVEYDLFFSTKAIKIDQFNVKLKLEELSDGRLTASVVKGRKMKFEPVDYRNSAAGNGSGILTGFC